MPCMTTRELLVHLRRFHHRLHTLYAGSTESMQRPRVKMLLAYLARHERRIELALTDYENAAADRILETPLGFMPDATAVQDLAYTDFAPQMTIHELVRLALGFDQRLVSFLREVAQRAPAGNLRDMFIDLVRKEQGEEHTIARVAVALSEVE